MGFLDKLKAGLRKTREGFKNKLNAILAGFGKVDEDLFDELEELLITSDFGVETTQTLMERLRARVKEGRITDPGQVEAALQEEIAAMLSKGEQGLDTEAVPVLISVIGVNGVGKTTTIGKLAYNFKMAGKKVVLGASDTFRAAAVDQLKIWADRVGVPIVSQGMGADPASVAFDTVKSAVAQGADVVLIDTAGRLHNKVGLMNELSKIKKVCQKVIPDAPHEVLLVLDASTGQNAIEQARQFIAATEVNALALTKLDGTAKGGVVIGISDQFKIPVKYIGVGEKMENLQIFDRMEFVDSLFN